MREPSRQTNVCEICSKTYAKAKMMPAALVRNGIVEQIQKEHPLWTGDGYICLADLKQYRLQYIKSMLESEKGELSSLDHQVIESLKQHETLASNVEAEFERDLTAGEAFADKLATFGGSWVFLTIFGAILLLWIAINSIVLLARPFDPYPFILLNLILSCLAAIQAPVIMMSQNRQEAKDRLRSEQDYRINLKAELEIRHLHEKIDHLLSRQWERLFEIQQIQIEMMSEVATIRERSKDG